MEGHKLDMFEQAVVAKVSSAWKQSTRHGAPFGGRSAALTHTHSQFMFTISYALRRLSWTILQAAS